MNISSPSAKRSMAAGFRLQFRSVISKGAGPVWQLVGLAVGLAVVSVVAGLSILAAGTSAGLISAISEIVAFMGLIGLGIAVGLLSGAFRGFGK
jgi:hypothetical protein